MKYENPVCHLLNIDVLNARLQASGGIDEPTLNPVECSNQSTTCFYNGTSQPVELGVDCFPTLGDIIINFYYPGNPGASNNNCTYTIEGQPAEAFCDIVFSPGSIACDNSEETISIQCRRSNYTCAGNETVVVSCPGLADTTCQFNGNVYAE